MSAVVLPGASTSAALSVMQRSLTASRLRARCVAAESSDLSSPADTSVDTTLAENPTTLQLAASGEGVYAGTVVGNTALVVGVGLVLHVQTHLVTGHSPAATASALARWLRAAASEVLGTDTLPGCAASLYALLLQPSVSAAVSLCGAHDSWSVVVGAASLLAWMLPAALWGARVAQWRPFSWVAAAARRPAWPSSRHGRTRRSCLRLLNRVAGLAESYSWRRTAANVPRVEQQRMWARWSALFAAYRPGMHAFGLADWGIAIVSGVTSGAATASADACTAAAWGGWLLVVWSVLQLLLHAALRPMNSPLDVFTTIALDVVGVVGQVAVVLGSDAVADAFTVVGSMP